MFLQNTDLNIVPGGIIPVMHVSQYDVGRELKFVLYDGYDTADITTGMTVTIEGTKPDGHGFQYSGVLDQNAHTATFVTTEQMTVLAGAIECKLTLYLNSQRIGTALFILDVEKAGINDSTIISDTELPLIIAQATEQMERAEAAADAAALSETNAATSETNAATSETNAANSEIICGSFMRMAGASAASAEQSAIISGSFMRTAGNYADDAEASAASANVDALKSEGHAIGKQNGVPVTSESPYYHNNAEYWAGIAEQYARGGLIYKGSILFANIPTTDMHSGDMYNIEDDFTTDSRFQEGAGKSVKAGTNIAWNPNNKWDVLAMGSGHTILDEDGITYPQRSKLQFEGCEVTDDAVNGITVVKCEGGGVKKYAKPVITVGTYTYNGTTQAPTITGFDANVMTLTGTYEATNAGSYTFTIALKDKTSSMWTDGTQDDIVTSWSIGKANSNTTASASSVSLNTSNTSRTVTLSNVTGTVTVSSSNTSVATASVSNNTVTITGVNHKDGSATITISVAASTNYKAKTLTVSVSASYKSTITVTLYSAASDTVSFTDDAGSKTAVTDTSGKKTSVSIVIPYNGKTITFTSSVAKNPSNLSNAYSKSIALTRSTTTIKVMPEHTLYWYGYENCTVEINGYKPSWTSAAFTKGTMTKGTNYMTITGASGGYCSFWLMPAVTAANLEKFKAIASAENGDAIIELAKDYINNYTKSMVDDMKNDIKSYEMVPVATKISGYSGTNIYCKGYVAPSKTITVKAFWYE